jgi:hypothetical protein
MIFVCVSFTEFLIMDGRSSWMKGVMLLGAYVVVGISYWVYPNVDATDLAGAILVRIRPRKR